MSLSARAPAPVGKAMEFQVEDASRLWKGIPTENITDAVEAAMIDAGAFPATNGLVAKIWADRKKKLPEMDHAALGRRYAADLKRALEAPGAAPPSPEERDKLAAHFRALSGALASGKPLDGIHL